MIRFLIRWLQVRILPGVLSNVLLIKDLRILRFNFRA